MSDNDDYYENIIKKLELLNTILITIEINVRNRVFVNNKIKLDNIKMKEDISQLKDDITSLKNNSIVNKYLKALA